MSEEGKAKYDFEHEAVKDGDTYQFGDLVLTAKHTPGHTPEHMSYEAAEKKLRRNHGAYSRAIRSSSIPRVGLT